MYAQHGAAVFPAYGVRIVGGVPICGCHLGPECPRPGKHPANEHGLLQATTDPFEIRGAWNAAAYAAVRSGRTPFPLNVGLATGSSSGNLVAVDIDPKPPASRDEKGVEWGWGYSSFRELEQEVGTPFPDTLASRTGSGGRHLLARATTVLRSRNGLRESVDVKAEGGYIIMPPSWHHSGGTYSFVGPCDFGRIAMLPPEWMKALASESAPREHEWRERTVRRKVGVHRASMAPTVATAMLAAMLKHPLVAWATEHPDDVSREAWRGIATNLATLAMECPEVSARCRRAFHVVSSDYTGYTARETDRVFSDALKSAAAYGPLTFARIGDAGAPDDVCVGGSSLIHAARTAVTVGGRS